MCLVVSLNTGRRGCWICVKLLSVGGQAGRSAVSRSNTGRKGYLICFKLLSYTRQTRPSSDSRSISVRAVSLINFKLVSDPGLTLQLTDCVLNYGSHSRFVS